MPHLDENRCQPGAPLSRMFSSDEATIIKRFINAFRVETWNGSKPFVDRSHPYGEYTIYIPRTGGAGVRPKISFDYALSTIPGESEGDPDVQVVNINAGCVRMHGVRIYTYTPPEGGSLLPLVGSVCTVLAEMDRVGADNTITLSAQTEITASTGSVLRIPLHSFTSSDGIKYVHQITHSVGDINIAAPIR